MNRFLKGTLIMHEATSPLTGTPACHRIWFKNIFNPILRKIGRSIVTVMDENNKVIGYELKLYPLYCGISKK